ncbi:unnamed protein product [Didymodactylos carnosus]|uniref:SGNH hydrolase-type esterase domain-containing protein n=1 Tax=Didymodactylos carnosus TaxID=1234261 RepID=A0A815AWW2_9BILA|nr:unnamed protein product [Didymodactylos carnosus]CAF1265541.1 unnamed protein product [Didymodactylos carnosus]CAF3862305.1 unnamed protein product [Didymodactylos carnosus]CAF4047949.1 unnamed protein product [Didymodactylos carnosus]
MISITITGTSITRDLDQGEPTLDGKLFKVQVRTKPSCTIEQMTELVKWKHFDKSKGFIMSIGTVNMKYDTPDVAIAKTANLIREFKLAYLNTKLPLTTLPHIRVSGLKPTIDQVKVDTDGFNARLSSLADDYIDVIKVRYTDKMLLRDGFHLNSVGTKELTNAMNKYLNQCF